MSSTTTTIDLSSVFSGIGAVISSLFNYLPILVTLSIAIGIVSLIISGFTDICLAVQFIDMFVCLSIIVVIAYLEDKRVRSKIRLKNGSSITILFTNKLSTWILENR